MVVSVFYVSDDLVFFKLFVIFVFMVLFCCLWLIFINIVVGVLNIDKDLINVSKVLCFMLFFYFIKIVFLFFIFMIFIGFRLLFGIGWMVLIVVEMFV